MTKKATEEAKPRVELTQDEGTDGMFFANFVPKIYRVLFDDGTVADVITTHMDSDLSALLRERVCPEGRIVGMAATDCDDEGEADA